jgi:hypothetical protein
MTFARFYVGLFMAAILIATTFSAYAGTGVTAP